MHEARTQDHVADKRRQDKAQKQCWNVFAHAHRDASGLAKGTANTLPPALVIPLPETDMAHRLTHLVIRSALLGDWSGIREAVVILRYSIEAWSLGTY